MTLTRLCDFLDSVGHGLRACVDTSDILRYGTGDPAQVITSLGRERIGLIQMKDSRMNRYGYITARSDLAGTSGPGGLQAGGGRPGRSGHRATTAGSSPRAWCIWTASRDRTTSPWARATWPRCAGPISADRSPEAVPCLRRGGEGHGAAAGRWTIRPRNFPKEEHDRYE